MPEASECVKKRVSDGTSLTKDFLVQWQAKLGSSNGCLKVSAPLYLVPKVSSYNENLNKLRKKSSKDYLSLMHQK